MPGPDAPPPRVVAAVGRLVGPARLLRDLARLLAGIALVGGVASWLALFHARLGDLPWGTAGAGVGLIVLLVPAWWLRHAASTFGDVLDVPARLEALRGVPRDLVGRREERALRGGGGVVGAVRTVRSVGSELWGYVGPASSVVELAAPTFWAWTAAAAVAAPLLVLVALVAGAVALLT